MAKIDRNESDAQSGGKLPRKGPSRRLLILGGLAVGGGVAIGAALAPYSRLGEQRRFLARPNEHVLLSAVRIAADDTITVIYPHADMGVGNGTALAQILAEELGADWTKVRIERAPAETAFANGALGQAFLRGDMEIPAALAGASWLVTRRIAETMHLQITGGSTAIALTGMEGMRHAGASARYMLRHAAANAWGVPVSEVQIENSVISHSSGKSSGIGAFAEASLVVDPPARMPFRTREAYKLIGQSKPRLDIPAKVTGQAIYSGDVRLPDMLFAAITPCPVPGGVLADVDVSPAEGMRGVAKVVRTRNAVAVLADSFWRARKAVEALDPKWDEGKSAGLGSAQTLSAMRESLSGNLKKDHIKGDPDSAIAGAGARVIERTYEVPYLAHAAMEPVGCVAQFKAGELHVWGAFQDALGAKFQAMKTAGLKEDAVHIHHTEMGGAFGRRGVGLNFLDHAIEIAQQTDRPVNLLYTREQDMAQDFYRNPSVAVMRAVLDESGLPRAVTHAYAERHDPKDASRFPYAIGDIGVRFSTGGNPAPWGPWRSVDHSVQGFFIESFMDELAHAAGQDPLEYRRKLLSHDPRTLAVLDAVAEMSGWRARGQRAFGVAVKKSFGTVVAEVAEVVITPPGRPHVVNVWVAADPGLVVNPNGFAQQMESGVIYGLTAALFGEITFEKGRVMQRNFPDYPMVQMRDCPRITVKILESGARTGGAGEPGTPPIAAAVANAIYSATGERIRALPFSKVKLSGAQNSA